MYRKVILKIFLIVLLSGVLIFRFDLKPVTANHTIYIRATGEVEGTDKILRNGNTYLFIDDINDSIVVERSNITIDGNGYTLQSTVMVYQSGGIELKGTENVTILNVNVKDFGYGVFLNLTSGSTISGSNITNNQIHGIWLHNSSNNIVIGNNIRDNGADGIALGYSDNNTISCNNITRNEDGIDMFYSSFNNTIHSNDITYNSRYAIELWHAFNNTIQDNLLTNNSYGLYSLSSSNNKVYGNNITANDYGAYLYLSSYYTLAQNIINGNKYNFYVGKGDLSFLIHSIDVSNIVDGKPVYYLVNQKYLTINSSNYPEVGYLALVNCTNMVVRHLTLTANGQGLLLEYVRNSRIINNNLSSNLHGVYLGASSSNNTVYGNTVTKNVYGITLDSCSDNFITGNNITNNGNGINLNFAFYNNIFRNNITNNSHGLQTDISSNNRIYENDITNSTSGAIHMASSEHNSFYHNSLINNEKQATLPASPCNIWDNSLEGNYWSDYIGNDANYNGIGDTPYFIDAYNQDNYPLMGMFSSFSTSYEYTIDFISNSSISDVSFNLSPTEVYPPEAILAFNVSGKTGTEGFLRVCIPKILINGSYVIMFDDETITNTTYPQVRELPCSNETYEYLYINYTHSEHTIIITGTAIIPEFPLFLILSLFMIATLLTVIVYRRKHCD